MASSTQGTALRHQEQFFNIFRLEASALQEQMGRLESRSAIGGERQDAIDHCLGGIARLQREVQDAASYTTPYDQKVYSQGIKALHEKLAETRAALAPRPRFAFKSHLKKNDSAMSLSDATELAAQQQQPRLSQSLGKGESSEESSVAPTPAQITTPPRGGAEGPHDVPRRGSLGGFLQAAGMPGNEGPGADRGGSGSVAVNVSSRLGAHITLPATAAQEACSASMVNLQRCVVDMSVPTSQGKPYANLAIRNVSRSLLICGSVTGSAHVTAVRDSVILVSALQLRMHECRNCIVYLHVNSAPVIENCGEMQFAMLPPYYLAKNDPEKNQWNQVQDFSWLRSEPNPHWRTADQDQRMSNDRWSEIASKSSTWSLEEILKAAGVPTCT